MTGAPLASVTATADRLVILITGAVGSGKSRLLQRLHRTTRRAWQTGGFVATSDEVDRVVGEPARAYHLAGVDRRWRYPWAVRRPDGDGFDFDDTGRRQAEAQVRAELDGLEICFLDEIGPLELAGGGLRGLAHEVLASKCRIVVLTVKKTILARAITELGLNDPLVIDLDVTTAPSALRQIRRRIAATDAAEIGLFAGTAGVVEIGLGSMLHALRVPLKGHFLAYLQSLLLVTFGKALHGRALVRISLLGAMLKAFSPMGKAIRPMLYIFIQGCAFALPVGLVGWNLPAVLAGAVLMSWLTLVLSLGVKYLTFGGSFFAAVLGLARTVGDWLGATEPSLLGILAGLLVLKALLAIGVAAAAYYIDVRPLISRLQHLGRRMTPSGGLRRSDAAQSQRRRPLVAALRDLVRPRFLLLFFVSSLLVLFFAQLSTADWLGVVVRGLTISYLGFLALRHLDFARLANWLDRRFGLNLGQSTPSAFAALGTPGAAPLVKQAQELEDAKPSLLSVAAVGTPSASKPRS